MTTLNNTRISQGNLRLAVILLTVTALFAGMLLGFHLADRSAETTVRVSDLLAMPAAEDGMFERRLFDGRNLPKLPDNFVNVGIDRQAAISAKYAISLWKSGAAFENGINESAMFGIR